MPRHDHKLVGALIKREAERIYPTKDAFAAAIQVSRATVYRIYEGDVRIKPSTHRRIEHVLDFPQESLDLVREHDIAGLLEMGLRTDALSWVRAQIVSGESPKRNHSAQ